MIGKEPKTRPAISTPDIPDDLGNTVTGVGAGGNSFTWFEGLDFESEAVSHSKMRGSRQFYWPIREVPY